MSYEVATVPPLRGPRTNGVRGKKRPACLRQAGSGRDDREFNGAEKGAGHSWRPLRKPNSNGEMRLAQQPVEARFGKRALQRQGMAR